ncbi:MAG: transporter related [Sphaerisporangium sp.]|nr:transporter related [Sphaerisporangium sp.]
MNDAAPALSLRGLTRSYPSGTKTLEVLKGVDLDVYPGEIVGLIGPSGSGKSSLLHAAGLLERPTGGKVILDGADASKLNDGARTRLRLRGIGFIYQFHHLLAEFSAIDNVALPVMIAGGTRRAARARAEDLLTRLGLAERLSHQPGQLSGGEQQRVAIARALIGHPPLLLADEPTGNLDSVTGREVMDLLASLRHRFGMTMIIATHNPELAASCDRLIRLRDGSVVSDETLAPADDVLDRIGRLG